MNARLFIIALIAASPLCAFAQNAPPPPALPASSAPAAQAVTLRLKFVPGQTRRYKTTVTTSATMLTGQSGAGIPLNTTIVMTMRQTVKDVRAADGAATIESQIETMQMSMNGKEMPMPAAQQETMKKSYTSVLLPTGKVVSFQMPSMPSGGMPGMDFSKGLSAANIAFPDTPEKVGDTWSGTADLMGIKMLITSAIADLSANDPQLATITQKLNGDINLTLSKNMPVTMNMTGKLTGSGTQVFDVTAGAVARQNMVMDMDVLMKFTPPSGQPAPAGMPKAMKMSMKETMTLERLNDDVRVLLPAP